MRPRMSGVSFRALRIRFFPATFAFGNDFRAILPSFFGFNTKVTTLCGNACLLLPWKSRKGCRIRGMISENFYSLYLFVFTPDSGTYFSPAGV